MQVWLYHYYFRNLQRPIIIQAMNKGESRWMLASNMPIGKDVSDIEGETVSQAVTGISERWIDGKKYLWAGIGYGQDGWMPADEYEKAATNQRTAADQAPAK